MRIYRALLERWGIRAFVIVPALVYVGVLVGMTVAFADDLPTAGWVGLGIVVAVIAVTAIVTIVALERMATTAGMQPTMRPAAAPDERRRLLVIADAGCLDASASRRLPDEARERPHEMLVVAPLLLPSVRYVFDDEDAARAETSTRLESALGALATSGVSVRGRIGSDHPLETIEDALSEFPASEIMVVTPPPEDERWLEHNLAEQVREVVRLPVTHLVLELAG